MSKAIDRAIIKIRSKDYEFDFEALPTDRSDSIWSGIKDDFELNWDELSALKNQVCPQSNKNQVHISDFQLNILDILLL